MDYQRHGVNLMPGAQFAALLAERALVFATWNASDKGANITLSGGNLSTAGATTFNSVRCTVSASVGKRYFENKVTAVSAGASVVGFGTSGMSLTSFVGNSATSAGVQTNGATTVNGITNVNASGVTWAVNDFMNFAIDYDAGKIWLGKNGTWVASGDPVAGTNPWCTFTANTALFPAWSSADASNTGTANFGASVWNNAPPSGYGAGYFT